MLALTLIRICIYMEWWSCQLVQFQAKRRGGIYVQSGVHRCFGASNEGVWMKEFISDLGIIPSASGPMKNFCDNTGAIAFAKESRFHKRTKHIKRRFNSIRDQVKEGDIEICKIHTYLNVADPLTKPLPREKHDQCYLLSTCVSFPLKRKG